MQRGKTAPHSDPFRLSILLWPKAKATLEGGQQLQDFVTLTRLPIITPEPPTSGGRAQPGGGHTRDIVSPTPELLLQLWNFPSNAWAANTTTGRSERVFGDTASLLGAGGCALSARVRGRGCWQPGSVSSVCRPHRCGGGRGPGELLYRKIKHFSVNMCAVQLEQCYHCVLNGPKGFGGGAGRGRKDGFNYLQGRGQLFAEKDPDAGRAERGTWAVSRCQSFLHKLRQRPSPVGTTSPQRGEQAPRDLRVPIHFWLTENEGKE